MDLTGVSALVTGGGSGLGAATVRSLARAGVKVVILDLDGAAGEHLREELGEATRVFQADVTDELAVSKALELASEIGIFRIAVNCAGIAIAERTLSRAGSPHDLRAFERIIKVNLIGTFNVLRLAALEISKAVPMQNGGRGAIVNTASIAAYDGQIGQIAYSASKAAIAGLTLPAARDLSSVGIRVVTIAPGIMDTPLLGQLPETVRAELSANIPFPRRLGAADEFASLVMEIIRNEYLNGEVIRLDGALRMAPR